MKALTQKQRTSTQEGHHVFRTTVLTSENVVPNRRKQSQGGTRSGMTTGAIASRQGSTIVIPATSAL
jgi:hypothetical protein